MKKLIYAKLIIATLLSSCTLAPAYKRPELPIAKEWPQAESSPQTSPSATETHAVAVSWKEFFTPPTLQEVIQTALDNNRDLKVAVLNVEAARSLYRIERATLAPSIEAGVSGVRQNVTQQSSSTRTESTSSLYTANLASTAFEIDLFGRIQSLNNVAWEKYAATQAARDAAQVTLIAETANAYLQLLADRKTLSLSEATLAAQEKAYTLISKSYENGIASKLDLSQARTALEAARLNQALASRQVEQDKNALILLMGTHKVNILANSETLDDITIMNNLPVGLPSEVLLMRPDVKQAEYELKAANANIGAARAAFFPSLSLTGSYGFASDKLSNLFSSGASDAWAFAPKASLPIFQGGANIANLRLSKVNKEIAITQYEKSIQNAFREVADELATRKALAAQLESQRRLVKAHQEAYDIAYARYKQGTDSYLTVLDTHRSLFIAQQNEIAVEKQRLSNLVNLYKALGGGIN